MPSSHPTATPETHVAALSNGLRVAVTPVPHSQAATLAAYVGVGSRDEARATLGLSHYLEHMLFKGTERRPEATSISAAIEGAGGSLNAYTTRELTAYWNRVPYDRLPLAMDVLADSVLHSTLQEHEIERERTVICSEIRRAHDQPGQRAGQLISAASYGEQPLAWEVAGDLDSVGAVTREHLADHIDTWYRPENIVLSVAGNVSVDEVMTLAETHWAAEPGSADAGATAGGWRVGGRPGERGAATDRAMQSGHGAAQRLAPGSRPLRPGDARRGAGTRDEQPAVRRGARTPRAGLFGRLVCRRL